MQHVRARVFPALAAATLASAGAGESALVNHSVGDWWTDALEEDAVRSLPLDGEGGLWASAFVPPPPRPDYLDDSVTPDGLTTCDLCTWAWHDRNVLAVDVAHEGAGELGWVFTLAIVSLLSAAIGAVVMITLIQYRNRIKNIGSSCLCISRSSDRDAAPSTPTPNRQDGGDKSLTSQLSSFNAQQAGHHVAVVNPSGVWSWLSIRRPSSGPIQLSSTPTAPAENHYTLDETYTNVDEALYAELDRESNPAYQNTAYNDNDLDVEAVVSSAPSSAYYSDLSCADRTYETVGAPVNGGVWEVSGGSFRRCPRLSAITETVTVPSDYV